MASTPARDNESFIHLPSSLPEQSRKCSLLVIDRTSDLNTPLAHRASSLASRVFATLPRREFSSVCPDLSSGGRLCDVYLESRCLRGRIRDPLLAPLSGVNSLRLFVPPCITSSESGRRMITQVEEQSFAEVSKALVDAITTADSGALTSIPSKKRGPGAETLALTQVLLNRSEFIPLELVGQAVTIIETMQRSSGKQWMQVCSWRCSFEVKEARERTLARVIQSSIPQASTDSSVASIGNDDGRWIEILTHLVRTGEWLLTETEKKLNRGSKEPALNGPVDIVHVFSMLFSYIPESKCPTVEDILSTFSLEASTYLMQSRLLLFSVFTKYCNC